MNYEGMFELHFTVIPEDIRRLFGFILNNSNLGINVRATCPITTYGDYRTQPMLTMWKYGNEADIVNYAKSIEMMMTEKGMTVIRTKVESMLHNKGVPFEISGDYEYYEFHFKVKINNTSEWNRLAKLIIPYGAHLSFNSFSKSATCQPIVTLRKYNCNRDVAESDLEELLDIIKNNNFEINGYPEKEYSTFDTNINLDKNWIFSNNPYDFITTWSDNMIFD